MNLPKFRSGQELNSTLLNQLSAGIRRAQVTSVIGGTFASTPGGTAIMIDAQTRGGGASNAICPFQVTTANDGDTWKFSIAWGMVGVPPVLPIGMLPNNDPPLKMDWNNGWVYMRVEFVENDTAVKEVQFKNETKIPPADETYAYYPIAYIDTDSSGGTPTQRIQNLCSAPIPSVCDLALPTSP
jgi:hypothetical protein